MEPIIPCIFSITPLQKRAFLDFRFPWKEDLDKSSPILTKMLVVGAGWKLFFKKLTSFQLFKNCVLKPLKNWTAFGKIRNRLVSL